MDDTLKLEEGSAGWRNFLYLKVGYMSLFVCFLLKKYCFITLQNCIFVS